jgi:hypothetical protein
MTGSFPFFLKNGTCGCVKRHTMLPTGHPGLGEITMTTFSTVHLTGQGPSAETTVTISFTAERSSLPSTSTTTHSTVPIAAQHSLPNLGRRSGIAAIVASTSVYVGRFPFNSGVPVEPTATIDGSLEWNPKISPTNTKIGQTYLQARVAITASATCSPGFQIVNPKHSHPCKSTIDFLVTFDDFVLTYSFRPAGNDSLAIVQAPTSRRLEFPPLPFPTTSAAHPEPSKLPYLVLLHRFCYLRRR